MAEATVVLLQIEGMTCDGCGQTDLLSILSNVPISAAMVVKSPRHPGPSS